MLDMWPTWQQAGVAAAISAALWLVLRRVGTRWAAYAAPFASEFAFISVLYGIWRLARMLPLASTDGAIDRAHDIASFQAAVHLPSELGLQHLVLRHEWLADATSFYYAEVHEPALVAFLVWLFVRHRDHYPHWRNALALMTAACLIIRFIRVAPPRFLPDLGYVDLATRVGYSIYPADVSQGVSDQFAAMPSIHVAWAAVVSFGIVTASTSRWRWLFLPHVVVTILVVAATGNHWWLDGIVAVALLAGGLSLDSAARRRYGGWSRRPADATSSTGEDETSSAAITAQALRPHSADDVALTRGRRKHRSQMQNPSQPSASAPAAGPPTASASDGATGARAPRSEHVLTVRSVPAPVQNSCGGHPASASRAVGRADLSVESRQHRRSARGLLKVWTSR